MNSMIYHVLSFSTKESCQFIALHSTGYILQPSARLVSYEPCSTKKYTITTRQESNICIAQRISFHWSSLWRMYVRSNTKYHWLLWRCSLVVWFMLPSIQTSCFEWKSGCWPIDGLWRPILCGNEFFLLVFFWFRDWPSDGVGERTSSSAEKRNIKKQRRFWATHVIRKWTFRIYPNFRQKPPL